MSCLQTVFSETAVRVNWKADSNGGLSIDVYSRRSPRVVDAHVLHPISPHRLPADPAEAEDVLPQSGLPKHCNFELFSSNDDEWSR